MEGVGLLKVDVEGVGADDLAHGEAHALAVGEEDAALQVQRIPAHQGADDGPVLVL